MKTSHNLTGSILVTVTLFLATSGVAVAAEAASTNAPTRLTERDYILEELKVAEEQLAVQEKQAAIGRAAPEQLFGSKRSVLSLKRQLAAHDERTKYRSPEQIAAAQQKADAKKSQEEEQKLRGEALKEELLSVLVEIARKDADPRVREGAVGSISRLRLASSIEPLGAIVLKDTEPSVRNIALGAIADFRSPEGAAELLRLYEQLPQDEVHLRRAIIGHLLVRENEPTEGGYTIVERVPTNAVPKLIQIAKSSSSRDLRVAALGQLNGITGEAVTSEMVDVYDRSGDNELKQSIVQLLGNRTDKQAMDKLVEIAKADTDPRSRRMAVDLLGGMRFDGERAAGPPRRVLRAPSPPPPR